MMVMQLGTYPVACCNKVRDAQGVPVEGTEARVQDMPELSQALRQQLLFNGGQTVQHLQRKQRMS